ELAPQAVGCVGFHPWAVSELSEGQRDAEVLDQLSQVESLIEGRPTQLKMIGEIGLDKARVSNEATIELQLKVFSRLLRAAQTAGLPVILHLVSADDLALKELRKFSGVSGFVHGFSGSAEAALRYIECGLKISVGPAVLKPGYKKLKNCLLNKKVQQHLLFETDQPHSLAEPEGYDFSALSRVISGVSSLTGVAEQELVDRARQNFLKLGL
ncbi:MAG: TatD family hydrolase, partial [Bdellovibrionales bacterium]|nr:TatD family hydrolase [Bdellovibrionales bacterium]